MILLQLCLGCPPRSHAGRRSRVAAPGVHADQLEASPRVGCVTPWAGVPEPTARIHAPRPGVIEVGAWSTFTICDLVSDRRGPARPAQPRPHQPDRGEPAVILCSTGRPRGRRGEPSSRGRSASGRAASRARRAPGRRSCRARRDVGRDPDRSRVHGRDVDADAAPVRGRRRRSGHRCLVTHQARSARTSWCAPG